MNDGRARHIILCADDYGISPAVSAAIRDLIARGRINATSAMVASPHCSAAETAALQEVAAGRASVGLHLTLTGPFKPLTGNFAPLHRGAFPPLAVMARRALIRALDRELLSAEIVRQFAAFRDAFGRAPDFVDGHHHVHVFPQIGEALLNAIKDAAPNAWVRQCARARSAPRPLSDPKALFLDRLSHRFRALATACGIRTNAAFAGTYSFRARTDYPALFPAFLDGLPDGGLIMCHPGEVDPELTRLDWVTNQRRQEYAYFLSDAFLRVLDQHGVAIAGIRASR